MGAIRMIYDETTNSLAQLGWWGRLSVEGTRKFSMGRHRYCLQGDVLYLPEDEALLNSDHRLAWLRVRVEDQDISWVKTRNEPLPFNPLTEFRSDIGLGSMYSLRHAEEQGGRRPVKEFCSEALLAAVSSNPEVLDDLSKTDFERLAAELFARMGFEVDLFRESKDDGIDFLAIRSEDEAPFVLIAQCKHPDTPTDGRKRRKVGVSLMRELYGTAVWNDIPKCVMITSSEFTKGARKFAERKPEQIELANRLALLEWLKKYRWNADE